MIIQRSQTVRKRREHGYALLLVVFLATLMLLATVAVAPNILTEGKREQEKEMIWRGKQYVRGVKLHFRKYGRFPTTLDDLMKPKIGSLRFMRQLYKDPVNKENGEWRLIYVGPNGQLIGSLKPHTINLQMSQGGGPGIPASQLASGSQSTQPGANGLPGPAGTQLGGTSPGSNPTGGTGAPVGTDQSDSGSNGQAAPPLPDATIYGGNIIGVGSKIDKLSVINYEKAKNYRLFEFIWDPAKDATGFGQPGMQTGTGLGQIPGQNPVTPTTTPQQNPQQQ